MWAGVDVTIERAGVGVMGEAADQVLEGYRDWETGEIIDGTSPGFPRQKIRKHNPKNKRPRTIACPGCNRMFNSPDGMAWHRKAKEH